MKYSVNVNGKDYEVSVERFEGEYKTVGHPAVKTASAAVTPVAATTPAKAAAPAPAAQKPAASKPAPAPAAQAVSVDGTPVPSPMPGSVFDIRAAVGQTVAEGDVVLILEAMKMEIEVVAPCSGTIASISVNKGDAVDTGSVLAVLK